MHIDYFLEKTVLSEASDLHVCVGVPPVIRIHGELRYLDEPTLSIDDCKELAMQTVPKELFEDFLEKGQVDFSYQLRDLARFRVNAFRQKGSFAIAFRPISTVIPKIEDLGLPKVTYDLAEKQRGLILLTGPTGHGKSTTMAAMLNHINQQRREHIITVEDPVEYMFSHNKSIIVQREVGMDTDSFHGSLRAILREDPDVIMIGEMRDTETMQIALTAAETGHLVFSTLHTSGAAKSIDRIIDSFPPHHQNQVRTQLSTVLAAIISQQLMMNIDNNGRVLATEVMVWTPAIANLIRESRIHQINSHIQSGMKYQMHSMDACLANLYKEKKIDFQTAYQYAFDQDNFKKLLQI